MPSSEGAAVARPRAGAVLVSGVGSFEARARPAGLGATGSAVFARVGAAALARAGVVAGGAALACLGAAVGTGDFAFVGVVVGAAARVRDEAGTGSAA